MRAGDRVLVQLPNWWEAVISYYAVARLGAVFVPRMCIYRKREVQDVAERTGAKVILTCEEFRRFRHGDMAMEVRDEVAGVEHVVVTGGQVPGALRFEDLLQAEAYNGPLPAADDIHVILFTSGTTAEPKGVPHSFNTYIACIKSLQDGLQTSPADRAFMPSPIMHNTGLRAGVVLPLLSGCGTVLQDIWDAASAMGLIAKYRSTYCVGATPFVTMMLDSFDASPHRSVVDESVSLRRRAGALLGRPAGLADPRFCDVDRLRAERMFVVHDHPHRCLGRAGRLQRWSGGSTC